MSYHASHRKPPRQERWPDATPDQAWPAYVGADEYHGGRDYSNGRDYSGGWDGRAGYEAPVASHPAGYDDYRGTGAYQGVANGFSGPADAFDAGDGFDGRSSNYGPGGYRTLAEEYGYDGAGISYGTREEYAQAWGAGQGPAGYAAQSGYAGQDGYAYDGYAAHDGYPDPDGYADQDGWAGRDDYADRNDYTESAPDLRQAASGPMLIAPDIMGELGWLPGDRPARLEPGRGRLIIGAVTGFLAAAVAIGVSTLVAAFVRPQASPVIAVGGAFIDRTPSAVKNFAIAHFGENDKTVLLLGMYVMIAVIAMVVGCLARRSTTVGVAGLAVFGLFGAFVAITRPDSHLTDLVPSVLGGLAGIAAYLWLASAAAPVTPQRRTRASRHREAW